jgi:hypothetical protein
MNKLDKAIAQMDPTISELAEAISDSVVKWYGAHNYDTFKSIINERLKTER